MSITPEAVNQAISTVVDDNLQTDYVSARSVKNIQIDGNDVSLTIEMGYPAKSLHEFIRNRVTAALRKMTARQGFMSMSTRKSSPMRYNGASNLCRTSKTSLPCRREKGASENRLQRPILLWHWLPKALASVFWMPTFTGRHNRASWEFPKSRPRPTAKTWTRSFSTDCS